MPSSFSTIPRALGDPLRIAASLAELFDETAVARDRAAGTPKAERDLLRESGLLSLSIPHAYGGIGGSWAKTLRTVRIIARSDSSIAHVYAFHHLMLATVRLFGSPVQWEDAYRRTAERGLFWGNALNPLDTRTISTPFDGWRMFNGDKSFCSGARDSDMLIASARQDGQQRLVIAAIPADRDGLAINDDWDNIGQRQTDSGSIIFERVRIEESEILLAPGPLGSVFATLRPLIAQLILSNIYLGIAEGAFRATKTYTRSESRRWLTSTAVEQAQDPYALERAGEFWLALEGARLLNDRAAEMLDHAWAEDEALSPDLRGETAIAIATAKVAAIKGGMEITNRMFDVMGARSTTGKFGFDRFWRNLRTHSSHDPVDYKLRELGDWALNDAAPPATFYS